MFDALSERLGGIFDNLTGRGALSDKDVSEALREIRVALLEADVALPVVKDFIAKVKTRAVGEEVIRSVKPGQQVIKIVYDGLVDMLGGEDADTSLRIDSPPAVVMMAGLQGSGKTTTTGKLAKRLSEKGRKKVLLASLDVRRPAAMEQLAILADQCGDSVSSLPIIQGQLPADIAVPAKCVRWTPVLCRPRWPGASSSLMKLRRFPALGSARAWPLRVGSVKHSRTSPTPALWG